MRRPLLFLVVLVSLSLAPPAFAYDDDGHYLLTYFVARSIGYTPEQSYRIALANVGVDHFPQTEPIQNYNIADEAQAPRIAFHAFLPSIFVLDPPRAVATKNTILAGLRTQGYKLQNPGGALHAAMDNFSHMGYWSKTGHAAAGHTPDYLSFAPTNNPNRNVQMATMLYYQLLQFLQSTSTSPNTTIGMKPRHWWNGTALSHSLEALQDLVSANPRPSMFSSPNFTAAFNSMSNTSLAAGLGEDIPALPVGSMWSSTTAPFVMGSNSEGFSISNLDAYSTWSDLTLSLQNIPNAAGINFPPTSLTFAYLDKDNDVVSTMPIGDVRYSTTSPTHTVRLPVGVVGAITPFYDAVDKLGNPAPSVWQGLALKRKASLTYSVGCYDFEWGGSLKSTAVESTSFGVSCLVDTEYPKAMVWLTYENATPDRKALNASFVPGILSSLNWNTVGANFSGDFEQTIDGLYGKGKADCALKCTRANDGSTSISLEANGIDDQGRPFTVSTQGSGSAASSDCQYTPRLTRILNTLGAVPRGTASLDPAHAASVRDYNHLYVWNLR
jgi:hypothetical protein